VHRLLSAGLIALTLSGCAELRQFAQDSHAKLSSYRTVDEILACPEQYVNTEVWIKGVPTHMSLRLENGYHLSFRIDSLESKQFIAYDDKLPGKIAMRMNTDISRVAPRSYFFFGMLKTKGDGYVLDLEKITGAGDDFVVRAPLNTRVSYSGQ
jgi:hypothetical protein